MSTNDQRRQALQEGVRAQFSPKARQEKAATRPKAIKPESQHAGKPESPKNPTNGKGGDVQEIKWTVRLHKAAVDQADTTWLQLKKRGIKATRGEIVALCIDKMTQALDAGEFDSEFRAGRYRAGTKGS